tara:strand:- start:84 stop:506 length:423 start_codon:yes stop_codon:yes gene_type:complete
MKIKKNCLAILIMINNLPDDIVLYMSDNFLNKNNHRLLNTCGFYPDNEKQQKNKLIKVSAYRIKLFYLIKKKQIKLFREIDKTLKKKFYLGLGGIIRFNDKCLLYAPHVQYGVCRFCEQHVNKHPYNKMMNIYFELTTKQ